MHRVAAQARVSSYQNFFIVKWLFMLNKLAYVIVRENLNGAIVQSQVIDVLSNITQNGDAEVSLVWFYRIDYLFRKEESIKKIRHDLNKKGIKLIAIPFVSLGFPVSFFIIPFVLPQWILGMLWVCLVKKKRILHCRSYHAALVGACLKTVFPIKLIFDPRSPFPEENVVARNWAEKGKNYQFWKKIEGILCHKADAVIATSRPFLESLKTVSPDAYIEIIPNNYPASFYERYDVDINGMNGSPELIEVCYVGSFGHWNQAESYLRFVEYLLMNNEQSMRAKFIIQSKSFSGFEKALGDFDIDRSKLTILSSSQDEVIGHMSSCVVGVQIMSLPDVRLGIKFVEYLAAGLPVVVSENVRGAAELVKEYGVGFVLKADLSNKDEACKFILDVSKNNVFWRNKCKKIAEKLFSCSVVSNQLRSLYEAVER